MLPDTAPPTYCWRRLRHTPRHHPRWHLPRLRPRRTRMLIAPHSRFVLIGDSITDAGRARPDGEGLFDPYGSGYVNMLKSTILAAHPERHIRLTNMGESGNTVRDLKARWGTAYTPTPRGTWSSHGPSRRYSRPGSVPLAGSAAYAGTHALLRCQTSFGPVRGIVYSETGPASSERTSCQQRPTGRAVS